MFDFVCEIYYKLSVSNVPGWIVFIIYLSAVAVVVLLAVLVFFVGVKLFENSNFTMRKLLRARYSARSLKIRKTGFRGSFTFKDNNILFAKSYKKLKLSLEKGGMYSDKVLLFFVVLKFLVVPALSFLVYLSNALVEADNAVSSALLSFVFLQTVLWGVVRYQIKKEADKFKVVSYKLFKFLRNQLSAGIKITQALNTLHSVASDKLLKNRLLLLASHYASTNDVDGALKYITNYYQTLEAKSLALSIKQSIETGQTDKGFLQKEEKLFNMYLNVIKKNTQFIMFKYVMIGLLYGVVIVLIATYPMWLNLLEANNLLFGN